MHSLKEEIASRGYHVHRGSGWYNINIHQPVKVMKETNKDSINIDTYCCKTTTIK